MLEYCTAYVDSCHNKKEEHHLFPLIERRGIPRTGGPLAVMLAEHEQSRAMLGRLAAGGAGPTRPATAARWTTLRRMFDGVRRAAQEPLLEGERHPVPDGAPRDERGRRRRRSSRASRRPRRRSATAPGRSTTRWRPGSSRRRPRGSLVRPRSGRPGGHPQHAAGRALLRRPRTIVRYFSHENHAKIFPRTRGVIGSRCSSVTRRRACTW